MVKHTLTIRRQFADELFECVWPFCGVDAYRVKESNLQNDLAYLKNCCAWVIFNANLLNLFSISKDFPKRKRRYKIFGVPSKVKKNYSGFNFS